MRRQLAFWLPRLLGIVYVVFLSIFALDVLNQPHWILALLIHLIPSYLYATLTVIAWNFEDGGGVLFILAGVLFYIATHSIMLALFSILIGILFLFSYAKTGKDRIDWKDTDDV